MVERAMHEIRRKQMAIDKISSEETLVIAVMMLPSNRLREAFKRWGDILAGVPTQASLPLCHRAQPSPT